MQPVQAEHVNANVPVPTKMAEHVNTGPVQTNKQYGTC